MHYAKFIEFSKAGMDKGAFIMHRCNGATTDITPDGKRAVTKLKAVITQRFTIDGCEVDVEADCRFCFFFARDAAGDWKARLVRHWYEKDKMLPVNPSKIPNLNEAKLVQYPTEYRMLAYCQELTMEGIRVSCGMPGHRRGRSGSSTREAHDQLLWQCKAWLEGKMATSEDFEDFMMHV